MNFRLRSLIWGLMPLIVLGTVWWTVIDKAGAASPRQTAQGDPAPPRQERDADPETPEISFIESPSPQCIKPELHKDACYVQWSYLQVSSTSPASIISMTVNLDDRLRAYYGGFFQTWMYVPADMHTPGLKVACGPPNAGSVPGMGNSYAYTIRARESSGLRAANYGTVTCPADSVPVSAARLEGPLIGSTGVTYPFTATVSPITTTLPITYSWGATDQIVVTRTGGLSDSLHYSWSTPGSKEISLGAANPTGLITITHTIRIESPITGLTVSNDSPTNLGDPTTLSASIASGTNAIYSWDFGDGQNGVGNPIQHPYSAVGTYTATVTVSNLVTTATGTTAVTITEVPPPSLTIYLPLFLQR